MSVFSQIAKQHFALPRNKKFLPDTISSGSEDFPKLTNKSFVQDCVASKDSEANHKMLNNRFKRVLYPPETHRCYLNRSYLDTGDIPGAKPKQSPNIKGRDYMNISDIEGARPKPLVPFYDNKNLILEVKDITGARKYEVRRKIRSIVRNNVQSKAKRIVLLPLHKTEESQKVQNNTQEKPKDETSKFVAYQKNAARFFGLQPPPTKELLSEYANTERRNSTKVESRNISRSIIHPVKQNQTVIQSSKREVQSKREMHYYTPAPEVNHSERSFTLPKSSKRINPTYVSNVPLGTENTKDRGILYIPKFKLFKKLGK